MQTTTAMVAHILRLSREGLPLSLTLKGGPDAPLTPYGDAPI